MLNVDLAFRNLASQVRPVTEFEDVALSEATGRVAATDVAAPIDLPPFDASAMDGYAVRAAGLDCAGAKSFEVIDRSLAGKPATRALSRPQTAIRVFTGAVMPDGADAVVLQEDVTTAGTVAQTTVPVHTGQNVRHRGQDVRRGDALCPAGTRLTPYRVAWLAACGIERVRVARRIRVAVLSTGDELAEAGKPLKPGEIYDSNRLAILALMREKAVQAIDMGCLEDNPDIIREALLAASEHADVIVTSGGVSVGVADFVKSVVDEIGVIDFYKIALKPGKPLAVGAVGNALFFGLPGNPVSAIITYLLFVAPAIDLMGGQHVAPPLMLPAVIEGTIKHSRGRREYVRGTVMTRGNRVVAKATGDQGSNRLASFADANCLIIINEDVGNLPDGDTAPVILLPGEAAHPLREAIVQPHPIS